MFNKMYVCSPVILRNACQIFSNQGYDAVLLQETGLICESVEIKKECDDFIPYTCHSLRDDNQSLTTMMLINKKYKKN